MIATKKYLSRRTVLRGLGATIALPLLDGMVPAFAAIRNTAANPVRRLGAIYVPMGMDMAHWTPSADGREFELTPILQPLAPYRDRLLVLTGLDSNEAGPRPQDSGGPHTRVQAAWLTGVRAKKTQGADFELGTSMDQIAAREFAKQTQFASLELALESVDVVVGACDFGYTCAYTSTLAWRSPTTPLPMMINPRVVFERLFGDSGSTDPRVRRARMQKDASILDSVKQEVAGLQRKLGPRDQVKVNEYLEAILDIERRIQIAEKQSSRELPLIEQPMGIPASFEEHSKLMFDMLTLAYQTDLTRVATFMMSRELSARTYPEIGLPEPHHPMSHHQNNPEKLAKLAKLNTFHAQMFAYFVEKLRSTPDGDGSLLDHTLLLYGSGMSDPNLHKNLDLPTLVVAAPSVGVKAGRHVTYPKGTPLANLHLSLLDKMGVRVDRLGDSTGQLNLLSGV